MLTMLMWKLKVMKGSHSLETSSYARESFCQCLGLLLEFHDSWHLCDCCFILDSHMSFTKCSSII